MALSRRTLLQALAATPFALHAQEKLPPVRAVTKSPGYHWFGYYDKLQFDPSSRFVLGNEVDFQGRSPEPDDEIRLGLIDLENRDRWTELARTRAWCWQQGCMLQWLPGSKTDVIFNNRQSNGFVSQILNTKTRKTKTLPAPIYAISPDAKWAIHPEFGRLHDTRPGYGYAGVPDPNRDAPAPSVAGIWRLDLSSGKHDLLIPFSRLAALPNPNADMTGAKHWFNHLLVAPGGKRFVFLHRWQGPKDKTFLTRMVTSNPDGTDLYVLDPYGQTSHFIWRDPTHILAWARHPSAGDRFYLYEDRTANVEVVGRDIMVVNGHCTYLPDHRWILNDTYPDRERKQNPYLFNTETSKRYPLGHFNLPREYAGEFRCDTHPRFSPDGTKVTIDSAHESGRQIYLIDISGIVG